MGPAPFAVNLAGVIFPSNSRSAAISTGGRNHSAFLRRGSGRSSWTTSTACSRPKKLSPLRGRQPSPTRTTTRRGAVRLDQREKRTREKRDPAESLYLNGKRDSAWFDQIDGEVDRRA